jgi:hypothetical protein
MTGAPTPAARTTCTVDMLGTAGAISAATIDRLVRSGLLVASAERS